LIAFSSFSVDFQSFLEHRNCVVCGVFDFQRDNLLASLPVQAHSRHHRQRLPQSQYHLPAHHALSSQQAQRIGGGGISDVSCRGFRNHKMIIVVDFRSSRGFNETQRADSKLKDFIKNFAHFSIHNLGELNSEQRSFFAIDDYVDVICLSHHPQKFLDCFSIRL
jgi:hypothetical protein